MIETIVGIVLALCSVFFYQKGRRDESFEKKAKEGEIIKKHAKIDNKKVDRKDIYKKDKW